MAKRKQKVSNTPSKVKFNYPAISVIIPLYNAEKYLSECLDSILAQTFQNFEVIVVDDCSTDKSYSIVESYKEKFGGRLNLLRMRKKSNGGGSLPRNKGLEFSRGKYLYFMDSDDTITHTAFEELYNLAEKFDADVVHCEKFYKIPEKIWYDKNLRDTIKADNYFTEGRLNVTTPTVLSEDIAMFTGRKLIWNYWAQLVRHDFILENSIRLQDAVAKDMIFTICELCTAKIYVVVPNVIYNYRVREDSVSTENIDAVKRVHKWTRTIKFGIAYLDKFLSNIETFSHRPDLKYALFDAFVKQMVKGLHIAYRTISAPILDALFRKEFSDGNNLALTSYIFNVMNVQRVQFMQAQYQFNQFAQQAQKRIAELEAENKRLKQKG